MTSVPPWGSALSGSEPGSKEPRPAPGLRDEARGGPVGTRGRLGSAPGCSRSPAPAPPQGAGDAASRFQRGPGFHRSHPRGLEQALQAASWLSWAGYAKLLAGLADRAFRIHPARMSRLRKEKLGDEPPSDLESWQSLVACWEPLLESYRDVLQSGREQLHAALEGSLTILPLPRARYAQQQAGSPLSTPHSAHPLSWPRGDPADGHRLQSMPRAGQPWSPLSLVAARSPP